jgi:molecular chaperone DnaK (HSP70)
MIGVSLGSLNTCVGVVKGSNVDIILTDTSQRCLPTLVAFNERERSFADQANFTIKSNFANTVKYPTRYLGQCPDWPFINEERKYALCQPIANENGELVFEAEYKGTRDQYKPEAVMGVFFDKLKQNWFKKGYNTKDIVVSVPDYYLAHERQALIDAIKIADLNCVSLINESSAISINYGLFRRNQYDEKTPKIVGFVDMGESKTSVFFTSFTKNNHKVISVTTDRFCGARDIDYILMEHYGGKFKQKYGCDPLKSTKCKLRLLETIAKVRKILTGNRDTNLTIDSLMEDEDMNYTVSREEFENLSAPVITRFRQTLLKALEDAKLKPSDISCIEMVGDAVRIPIMQQIVKEVYGVELSKTLSPDECVARGSALYVNKYFNLGRYELSFLLLKRFQFRALQ